MDAEMPFPRWVQTLMVGGGIIYTILAAAGVTSVAYGIAWRRQGVRFFHQPGHWLLVDIGIFAVISSLMQLVVRIVWPRFDGGDVSSSMSLIWIINGISAVGGIAHIGFNIYISLKKCHERRWKWAFAVKAIAVVVRVVGDLVLMLLLLRAARVDRASKTPRDAMHWFGMWLQLAVSGFMVVFLILVVVFTIFTIRQFS
jgi:hypothetical protein